MSESPADPRGVPSARTRLLRAAADGELDAAERAVLDAHLAHHPEDREVIAFERRLRDELERTFSTVSVPAHLESRLRAMAASTTRTWWQRALPLLAAAGLLLALAIGLNSSGEDPEEFGFPGRSDLVKFLATHPADCSISAERTLDEFRVRGFGGAVSELGTILGKAPALGDLERTDLEFVGMQRCGVPGEQVSMHLLFQGAAGSPLAGELLSVYVQPHDSRLPLIDGAAYKLVPRSERFRELEMFAWQRGGLDYIVCTPAPVAAGIILASAAAPPVTGLL